MRRILSPVAILVLSLFAAFASGQATPQTKPVEHLGFDRNIYPGDHALPALRKHFAFSGYWLNNPPGESSNSWSGKRETLLNQGFGFLVLFNGRVDAEIRSARHRGTSAERFGQQDAAVAIASAKREGFPAGTIVFLDQEEGGRLLPEQSAYLFAWTEALSASTYRPGVYLSGQPVADSPGKTITTARDVREQIAAKHLHSIALFLYQDACPPSKGCTVTPPSISAAGTPEIAVWQYAQSPRRPEITHACAKTYAADNNCYAPGIQGIFLDMNLATTDDPSQGR